MPDQVGHDEEGEVNILATVLTAIALLLVFEGIIPFLSPHTCRKMMEAMLKCNNRTLRIMGFLAMLAGVVLMYLVHSGILMG